MKESLESTVKLQFPLLSAVVVPNELDPANSSTVLLASAVPVKVGVVSLVRLSLLDVPVSESDARSGLTRPMQTTDFQQHPMMSQ